MRILGLDYSSKAGFAIIDVEEVNEPVIVHTSECQAGKGIVGMRRAGIIAMHLCDLLDTYKPELIGIEDFAPNPKTLNGSLVTIQITAISKYFMHQEGYDYWRITPGSHKKFLTGNGAAKKDVMLKEVYKRFRVDTNSDNIADAVSVAIFMAGIKGMVVGTKTQQEAITAQLKKDESTWLNN